MVHAAEKVILVLVIATLYTVFIAKRPNAKTMSRRRLVGVFVVGLIISAVMLMSDNLYAPA